MITSEDDLKALCENVKRKCKITRDDEDTEKEIKEIVENAEPKMCHKLGIKSAESPGVFLDPGDSRFLFETYCVYDWNKMAHEFERNYLSEILTERHRYEVKYEREKAEQLQ